MTPIVKYKKLDARAVVPQYATPGAAAADLCAVLDTPLTLAPMQRALVPTGLAIELPGPACVALVYARSGLSIKQVPFSFSCFFKKFMKGIFICPVQCCFYCRKAFCETVDFKKQVFTVGKE